MTYERIAIVLAPRASASATGERVERDTAALFLALDLAARCGASTIALTVAGPMQTAHVCQEALDLGCQEAVCVRSPVPLDFFGAATLLSHVIREATPDLIVCGDHYTDHGGAAVAGALARLLDWPLLTGVIAAKINSKGLWAKTRTDVGQQEQQCSGPMILAALQVADQSKAPRKAKAKTAGKGQVEEVFADSLLEDTSILRARSDIAGYADFAASPLGVELISEPAELLSRLLKEKLWKP